MPEVRKTVTVLFADVTGSTALGEQLDPEALRRVLSRYFEEMRAVIESHGGTVEKFIGDAVMAVFGIPLVHEDDALRAVRAAAAMRERLAALNEELERERGTRLEARIGVNTGEVVAGDSSEAQRFATGDAVNVAARLEQAASPGEILIGETTRLLVRDAVELESVEPLDLKGKAQPVPAWRLAGVIEGAPAVARRLDSPLVGRGDELAQVEEAFSAVAADRRARLATLVGPPGIGKSRLAREATGMLAGRARILSGRCLSYGEGITFWPLAEVLQQLPTLDELLAGDEDADWIRDRVHAAAGISDLIVPAEEIFLAVRKLFERLARETPLVLRFEDIHWAEPAFLDLIEHVLDWSRDAPMLIICESRPELLEARATWAARAGALLLRLEPLGETDARALVDQLAEETALDEQTRRRLLATAEGNPLFLEQLLALFSEAEGLGTVVPPTIQALVAARLDALPDAECRLVEGAAVVGLEFHWDSLTELDPERQRPPGSLLSTLVRKELIVPDETAVDAFRFRHALIRDAAYERLPKERRAGLHERLAGRILALAAGGEHEELGGYHLEQAHVYALELGPADARTAELGRHASELLGRAGRRAYERGDARAAANLLLRAAALLPEGDPDQLELEQAGAENVIYTGDYAHAAELFEQLIQRATAAGDMRHAAFGQLCRTFVATLMDPGARLDDLAAAASAAEPVFVAAADERGLARVHDIRAYVHDLRGENTELEQEALLGLEHAQRAGDERLANEMRWYLAWAARSGPTHVDVAIARCREIAARGDAATQLHALFSIAFLQAQTGKFEEAHASADRAGELLREFGLGAWADGDVTMHGLIAMLEGDYRSAEHLFRGAYERAVERRRSIGYRAGWLAQALCALGRHAEAMELSRIAEERSSEGVVEQVGWRVARAKALAGEGGMDAALRFAADAVAVARASDDVPSRGRALLTLAELLSLAGRVEEARAVAAEAVEVHDRKGLSVPAARAQVLVEQSGSPVA